MLEALSSQNTVMLLVAVAGFWFFARFVVAPRRGAGPGLRAMFRRERVMPRIGLGRDAIATLLDDTREFVVDEEALRGLILAGPFAAKLAEAESLVTLILLTDTPARFAGDDWLARWRYIRRGHDVIDHQIETHESGATHRMTLRGAPPLVMRFEHFPTLAPPVGLEAALDEGSATIEDPAGQAEKLRLSWAEQRRRQT